MRILLSAVLAASVSFTAFAPAHAYMSSSSSSETTQTSSSGESGDSGNHGVAGRGDSATDAFLDAQQAYQAAEEAFQAAQLAEPTHIPLRIYYNFKIHRVVISPELMARAQAVYDEFMELARNGSVSSIGIEAFQESTSLGAFFASVQDTVASAETVAANGALQARSDFIGQELGLT